MKAAVLESHKELAIVDIERKLDALIKAKGITYDEVTPPVRNPNYRTLQALQRIDAKLALVLKAENLTEPEAAVIVEPVVVETSPEVQETQVDSGTTPGEKETDQVTEPEAAQPVKKPDRKTKTK
jgi:hypothetical protein